ncbi:MAG: hypothetical protein JXR34_06525 [Bacteroidales bacterium]|nr:hypothetical protein [Bacteroidales bacterium]
MAHISRNFDGQVMENQSHQVKEANYILQNLTGLIPNFEKAIVLFQTYELKGLIKTRLHQQATALTFATDFEYHQTLRFIEQKQISQWVDEKSLPFVEAKHIQAQKEVFSEAENSVLVVRQKGGSKHENLTFLLFFNPDSTNFGLSKKGDILTTTSKSIVEQIIINQIHISQKIFRDLFSEREKFKIYINQLKENLEFQSNKNNQSETKILSLKTEVINYLLSKFSKAKGVDIVINESAWPIIHNSELDLHNMENWLQDAVDFALFTDFESQPVLILDQWHFKQNVIENIKRDENSTEVETRYVKTYNFLDKLESAALKVVSQRMKLTGSTVGQAFDTPISAPAITDALRKHQQKINKLLQEYPSRWTLIRSEFRPVVNVIQNRQNDDEQIAS